MKNLTILLLLFCSVNTFAQNNNPNHKKWAAQLNVQHQDLLFDIDFGQLGVYHNVKIRPHTTLELYRFINTRKANRKLFGLAELGYFHNLYHDKWLALKLGIGSERRFGNFIISSRIMGGIARTQGADIQYVNSNGKWIVNDQKREPTLDYLMSPRVDLGYRIINNENPIDIFLNYQMTLYLSPAQQIGIPYHGYGLGVRYRF
ncbi:MAG: hypothetical protein AB8G11_21665 [Saprospiraceae bacterium]